MLLFVFLKYIGWNETNAIKPIAMEVIDMAKETFSIPNISCGHCVNAIKNELSEMEGIQSVEGSPEAKTVDVEWEDPASLDQIRATLKEINYPAQ
jgi:copper chaperone CopZ